MKKLCLIIVICISLLGMCSCKKVENNDDKKIITVVDMLGDSIEIEKNPKKVACVSRTTYDLLVAFGLGDKIDGAYKTIYDNPWTEKIYPSSKDEYRYEYQESYETFLSRGVDLVFAPEKYISDGLKEHGVNSLCVSLYGNPSFDEYVYFFADLVKQLWDDNDVILKVDSWKNKVTKAINDVKKDEVTKKIFYVRGDKNKGIGYTDNIGSFTEYAYKVSGFDFGGSYMQNNKPSQEEICKYNPDVFVIGGIYQNTLIEVLKNDEVYLNLDAVKNNKIYTIPVGLTMFEQLSCMTPIFFYDMSNKIYGTNYDVSKMVKDTIFEYFNTLLTDKEIEYMFNGKDYNGVNLA